MSCCRRRSTSGEDEVIPASNDEPFSRDKTFEEELPPFNREVEVPSDMLPQAEEEDSEPCIYTYAVAGFWHTG